MLDLLKSDEFEFWLPWDLDLKKAAVTSRQRRQSPEDQTRWIHGIASTEHKDLQNENVSQNGIDFAYFLDYGYYNNDHKPGFENKVGQPSEAKVQAEGLYTRGFLFKNHKVADAIWELAHALEASQAERKLGFSIQGKVIRRAGQRILKCWVQDIAITAAPINTHTWLDIVKSMNAVPADMWCESDAGVIYPKTAKGLVACSGSCSNQCMAKGISSSLSEEEMDIKKKQEEEREAEKAATAAGAAWVPESLHTDLAKQTYGDGKKRKRGHGIDKALSFDDCVHMLTETRGLSKAQAYDVAEAIFFMNQQDAN